MILIIFQNAHTHTHTYTQHKITFSFLQNKQNCWRNMLRLSVLFIIFFLNVSFIFSIKKKLKLKKDTSVA